MVRRVVLDNMTCFQFSSMEDFYRYMKKISNEFKYIPKNKCSSMEEGNENWNGSKNWEEFIERLKAGIKLDYVKDYDVSQKNYENRLSKERCYGGGSLNVPRFLSGRPKYFNRIRKNREVKFFKFYFNIGENWTVDGDKLENYHISVFEMINYLINRGHNVEVHLIHASRMSDKVFVRHMKIRESGLKVNQRRLNYFLTSPSLQRRGSFRLLECEEDSDIRSSVYMGYGRSSNSDFEKYVSKIDNDSGILVGNISNSSVRQRLKEIKKNIQENGEML